jgi:hypothetical protein
MIRLTRIASWAVLAFGLLLCAWGLIGTFNPGANGGYEVTRFLAKLGLLIALGGLLALVLIGRR